MAEENKGFLEPTPTGTNPVVTDADHGAPSAGHCVGNYEMHGHLGHWRQSGDCAESNHYNLLIMTNHEMRGSG